MNNNPEVYNNSNAGLNSFFTKMYGYMSAAVAVSALTAFFGSFSPTVIRFMSNPIALFAVFGVQLVLAYSMSSLKSQRSPLVSALGLFVFAGLEGLLFSGIFIVYTAQNITSAFVSAFVMFAVLSFMGSTTKRSLRDRSPSSCRFDRVYHRLVDQLVLAKPNDHLCLFLYRFSDLCWSDSLGYSTFTSNVSSNGFTSKC